MVTEFEVIDTVGKVIATGELEGEIYRVFSNETPSAYEEFESLEEVLAASGGTAIQPMLFETPARTRQLTLLGKENTTP